MLVSFLNGAIVGVVCTILSRYVICKNKSDKTHYIVSAIMVIAVISFQFATGLHP
jgi:hypothetical protein